MNTEQPDMADAVSPVAVPRIGFARLTKMAFDGENLQPQAAIRGAAAAALFI